MKAALSILLVALAGYAQVADAEEDAKYYACYSDAGAMKVAIQKDTFMARGACRPACVAGVGYAVMAMTKGTQCLCGQKLPNSKYKVDDSKCKQECGGFPTETCGSRLGEYFSVYTTGLEEDPEEEKLSSSSSSASKTSSSSSSSAETTSTTAVSATTTEVEATSAPEPKPVNKAGVAAGAVVGVLAIIGIGVGVWLFLRKRRRQQVEEEYRKSAAVRGFVQKPASDHRLDPGMVQRRDSVGSIADNQDYSRKILKVTNPDD